MKYGVDGLKRRRIGGEGSSSVATKAASSPRIESPKISKVLPSSAVSGSVSESSRDESVFDRDLLDCSICIERLNSPIYQCQNGHVACASCCKLTKNVCPSCQQPTGSIRCLVLEKLIESLKVKCKYIDSGCPETVKYSERDAHEKICPYESVSCPFNNCDFQDLPYTLFQDHLRQKHPEHWTSILSCPFNNCDFQDLPYTLFQDHLRQKHPEHWTSNLNDMDWNAMNRIFLKPKDRYYIVFSEHLCFVVRRHPIATIGIGDMCYVTVLKVLSERYATLTSIPYKMKLKTVSREDGGPSSTFTIEAECSGDDDPAYLHPRDDAVVVVNERNSVEILGIVFLP